MKKTLLFLNFILMFCLSTVAQNETFPCPKVSVTGPDSVLRSGEMITFTASILSEIKHKNLKYNWSVDKGLLIKGQNTNTIRVSTEGLSDTTIIASVEIELLNQQCESIASQTGVVAPLIEIQDYDDYGKVPFVEELTRFDPLIYQLQQNSEYQGYVLMRINNDEKISDVKKHIRKLIKYIKSRKLSADRFIFAIEKSDVHSTRLMTILKNEEFSVCISCEIIKPSDLD